MSNMLDYIQTIDLGSFGEKLRQLRLEKLHSQEEAASLAGISRQRLNDIENGRAKNLGLRTLQRLLAVYGMQLAFIPDQPTPDLNQILFQKEMANRRKSA